MISKKQLQQLLDVIQPASSSPKKKKSHAVFSDRGPGYLDKHLLFLEGAENVWLQREGTEGEIKQKKIIFSNALLNNRPLEFIEIAFFTALIDHYEVYLWQGSQTAFSRLKPLNNFPEFWDKKHFVVSACQGNIENLLAQQWLVTEDFLIIDYAAFCKLMDAAEKLFGEFIKSWVEEDFSPNCKFKKNKEELHILDFITTPVPTQNELKKLTLSRDPKTITTIKLQAPSMEEITALTTFFPALERIEIHEAHFFWLMSHLPKIAIPQVKLVGVNTKNVPSASEYKKTFVLPLSTGRIKYLILENILRCNFQFSEPSELIQLEITDCIQITKFDGNNLHLLEELILGNPLLSDVDLSNCHKLKIYKVNSSSNDLSSKLSPQAPLETLSLVYADKDLLMNYPSVKHLSIASRIKCPINLDFTVLSNLISLSYWGHLQTKYDAYPQTLKELQIFGDSLLLEFDLCRYPQLEKLVISNASNLIALNVGAAPALKHLSLRFCPKLETLDLKEIISLETINLTECTLEEIIFEKNNPLLRVINIKDCNVKNLFIPCDELETLSIVSCRKLNTVELPVKILHKAHFASRLSCLQLKNCKIIHSIEIKGEGLERIETHPLVKIDKIKTGLPGIELLSSQAKLYIHHLVLVSYSKEILKLSSFPALESLELSGCNNLIDISFDGAVSLRSLTLENCRALGSLNFSPLVGLKALKMDRLAIEKYDLSSLNKLQFINISNCGYKCNFDFRNLRRLIFFKAYAISLNENSFQDLYSLQVVDLKGDSMPQKFEDCKSLKQIKFSENSLRNLDLSKLPMLEKLVLKHLWLFSLLNLKNQNQLLYFSMESCGNFRSLNLSSCSQLKAIDISQCNEKEYVRGAIFSHMQTFVGLGSNNQKPQNKIAINLSHCFNLTKVTIDTTEDVSLNLLTCRQLHTIHIKAHQHELENIADCEQLRSKTISIKQDKPSLSRSASNSRNMLSFTDTMRCSLFEKTDRSVNIQPSLCSSSNFIERRNSSNDRTLITPSMESITQFLKSMDNRPTLDENFRAEREPRMPLLPTLSFPDFADNIVNPHGSYISFSDSLEQIGFDGNVSQDAILRTKQQGNLKFEIYSLKNPVLSSHFRFNVFNEVTIINNNIIFKSNRDFNSQMLPLNQVLDYDTRRLNFLKTSQRENTNLVLGILEGKLKFDNAYPLPSQHPINQTEALTAFVYCNHPKAIKAYWHQEHQQFYVRMVDSSLEDNQLQIVYSINQNPNSLSVNLKYCVTSTVESLLPLELITLLKKVLNEPRFQKLNFILDPLLPVETKIQLLVNYCKAFKSGKRIIEAFDFATLCEIMHQQLGACRHAAWVFMVLSRFLGIATLLHTNEAHAFCEVPYTNGETLILKLTDLGGWEIPCSSEKRESLLHAEEPVKLIEQESVSREYITITPKLSKKQQEFNYYQGLYYQELRTLIEPRTATLPLLFASHSLPTLIELRLDELPFIVNTQLIHYLQQQHFNVFANDFYIHRPEEFALYLRPYQLNAAGERHQITGPLLTALQQRSVIKVNWSTFSPTEVTTYQSLLDTEPTLSGYTVSKQVTVIGMNYTLAEECSSFLSRCQRWILPIFKSENTTNLIPKQLLAIEVDLFHSIIWREPLLGKILLKGKQIILQEGPLIQAIKTNQPLVIFNPPEKDEYFLHLLHKLQVERKLLFNGELLAISQNWQLELQTKSHNHTLDNVTISHCLPSKAKPIYLGLYNLHECYQTLAINQQHGAENLQGFLHEYQSDEHVFYLTESIPASDWEALLDYIQRSYPQKHFEFVLASGVNIGKSSKSTPKVSAETRQVFVSNDPDFCAYELASGCKNAYIVDIQAQTGFADLIAEIKYIEQEGFYYKSKGVLSALQEGSKVILNGLCNPILYQQLLPLLADNPHVYANGQRTDVLGELILVLPDKINQDFLFASTTRNYFIHDYLSYFPAADHPLLQTVFLFFDLAKYIPTRGAGRPATVELSHQRLSNMLHALKHKTHAHNPIKGFFHYDYPKDSEDYAYLNVIAKYLFAAQDKSPPHFSKLKQLAHDKDNNTWRLLNCFHGEALKQFLGQEIRFAVNNYAAYPQLTKDKLSQLHTYIDNILKESLTIAQKIPVNKQIQRMRRMLDDENTSLIIAKGATGIGKNFAIQQLIIEKNAACFYGEQGILPFLNDKSARLKLLIVKGDSKTATDFWSFLKGFNRDEKIVYYQGVWHKIDSLCKIIITLTPDSSQESRYYPIFQHHIETVLFQIPGIDFMERVIVKSILEPVGLYTKANTQPLLKAWQLIHEFNALLTLSLRDMESLAIRFVCLKKNFRENALLDACVGEFSFTIKDPNHRKKFVNALEQAIGEKVPDKKQSTLTLNNYLFSKEKFALIDAIYQSIMLREQAIENPLNSYKSGVLLEGESGLGKSTLFKLILESLGWQKDIEEAPKKYYETNAGDASVYRILQKAHHEGAIVILNESNLDLRLEEILTPFLNQGKDKNPGFMVLFTQNPSNYKGRKAFSTSFKNQLHFLYMDDLTIEESKTLAQGYELAHPKAAVAAYQQIQKEYPHIANPRTLFTLFSITEYKANTEIAQKEIPFVVH